MLTLPARRLNGGAAQDHPAVTDRPHVNRSAVGAGVVTLAGIAMVATTVATVGGIRRLRRSAGVHAHDLDHTATIGEGTGEPVRLLVLGDSAARGYGLQSAGQTFPHQLATHLARATGRRVDVASVATDGHRTADVLGEQVPIVRSATPDVVVVSVGVNDAIRVTPRRALREATRALLVGVQAAAGEATVTFVTCPDLTSAPGFPRPLHLVVGWRCRRVARIQSAVAGDLGVAAVVLPRPEASMFGVDGFHPGAAGQTAMAAVTVEAMLGRAGGAREAIGAARAPDQNGADTWTSS